MDERLLENIACFCQSPLVLDASTADPGTHTLRCVTCLETYPIVRGVPRFVGDSSYTAGFGFEWNAHPRTQHDTATGARISEERFFAETGWPRSLAGQSILEVGGGSGRFTTHAASTGARVVSVDLSEAVEANYASNGRLPNVLIIQADLYRMPVRPYSFDKVYCFGVLQHTPDVERAFTSLTRYLKPGGELVVDVYAKGVWWKHLLTTRYWVRPISRLIPPRRLYGLVRHYIRVMWPITRLIRRLPKGRAICWQLLVADYRGQLGLSDSQLKEWAVLDTFDILSARYDSPQRIDTVRRWFTQAALTQVRVDFGFNGIVGRGIRPRTKDGAPTGEPG